MKHAGPYRGSFTRRNAGFSILTHPALSMLFCLLGGGSEKGETVDGSEIRKKKQLRLVVYPIIYDGFCTPQVVVSDFLGQKNFLPLKW